MLMIIIFYNHLGTICVFINNKLTRLYILMYIYIYIYIDIYL